MKKRILFVILFLILITFSVSAQEIDLSKKGYKCLENEIDDKTCSALSLEEKTFALLSTGKCENSLLSDLKTEDCWGSGSACDVKETAQVIIALKMRGLDTTKYTPWLLTQTKIPTDMDWLLQVDLDFQTTASCTINTETSSYSFDIGENEKINPTSSSPCFSVENEYWLEIKPQCYEEDFEISCNEDFSSTFFFKKKLSSAIHVLDDIKKSQGEESVLVNVESFCFKKGNNCDYEGSLWATFALDLIEEDYSSFMPYLLAVAETNDQSLPESFLYYLTDDEDFAVSLNAKQKLDKYWSESGDRFYDTAVALFPFSSEEYGEKTNTLVWLEENQENNGCWDNKNIVNTAFILYSVWPKKTATQEQKLDCVGQGYSCVSSAACFDAEGNKLEDYSCSGFNVCCDAVEEEPTCDEISGIFCSFDEVCKGSSHTEISAPSGETCCVGTCEEKEEEPEVLSECQQAFGTCKTSCDDKTEKTTNLACDITSDVCCMAKEEKNLLWLWITLFVILVAAVILLFRKKIFKPKIEEVPGGVSTRPRRPGVPPAGMPPRRPVPLQRRKPLPRKAPTPKPPIQSQKSVRAKPSARPKSKAEEREEILRKLKEMGSK